MKHTLRSALALCVPLLAPSLAVAQNVSVAFQPGADAQQAADLLGEELDAFSQLLENEIADALGLLNSERYLQPFADAQAFSSRGLTADYASEFGAFLVGFGVASAVAISDDIDPDNVDRAVDGVAPNASGLVGVDMGILGIDGLRIFVSGFRRGGSFGENDEFDLNIENFGIHGQLRLFGGEGDSTSEYVWDWRGLDITAGLNRSTTTLTLTQELPTELELTGSGQNLPVELTSVGTLELEASAVTIPIEVSTAITLLSIATIYGGVGTDIQLGDATIRAQLDGGLVGENPQGGDRLDIGTVAVSADDSADASPGRLRTMLGVQANLWALKLYVQVNALPGVAASVAGGLKLAF